MFKNVFFLLLISFSTIAYSQNGNGFIGIAFGGSNPIGDFADDDIGNENAVAATNGGTFSVDMIYMLHKHYGLTGKFYGSGWEVKYPIINDGPAIFSGGLLLGGVASVATGNVSFDFKLLLGFASSKVDSFYFESGIFTWTEKERRGSGLASQWELGVRFHAGRKIDITAGIGVFYSPQDMRDSNRNLTIRSSNLSIGMGYRL
jgi:hypothetical protein